MEKIAPKNKFFYQELMAVSGTFASPEKALQIPTCRGFRDLLNQVLTLTEKTNNQGMER